MKILICSANYAPELTGVGKYSGDMAEWLAEQGHDVRVVAAPPYYPAWRIADNYRGWPYRQETLAGVRVWRAPLWVPSRPGGVRRVLHLLSFAFSSAPLLLWWGLSWRPQVCIAVAPFFTAAPATWLAAKLAGTRSWLHVQDYEVDVAFGMGLLKGGGLKRIVFGMERWIFQRFDRVSSISLRMLERARTKGVEAERLTFFRNWVDIDRVQPLDHVSAYRALLGLGQRDVVVLFSGTLGSKQGLQLIPEVARALGPQSTIHFVICGDGPQKPELQRLTAGLPCIHFLPLQPLEQLSELLGLADIHLLTQDVAAEDLVLPSKLSGMLSSGRPIVATCAPGTEMAQVVEGRGRVVPPGQPAELAAAIHDLAADPVARQTLGQAARRYAENCLGRERVLQHWAADLARLIAQ